MEPPPGHPLEAAFKVSIFETIVHIVGGIDTTGDYHEFFTIKEIPQNPELIESRLLVEGTALGPGGTLPFITTPSTCLVATDKLCDRALLMKASRTAKRVLHHSPVGASGCNEIPFKPTIKVTSSEPKSDAPDGVAIKVEVPQNADPAGLDSSMLKDARVTLPEGMTLNPAAAGGLQACTDQQFGKGTTGKVECPTTSQVGTTTIETPDLPSGSLTGSVYVGQPTSTNPRSGNEYRIFIDAGEALTYTACRCASEGSYSPTRRNRPAHNRSARKPTSSLQRFHRQPQRWYPHAFGQSARLWAGHNQLDPHSLQRRTRRRTSKRFRG